MQEHIDNIKTLYSRLESELLTLSELVSLHGHEPLLYEIGKQDPVSKEMDVTVHQGKEGIFHAARILQYIKMDHLDSTKEVPRLPGVVFLPETPAVVEDIKNTVTLVNQIKSDLADYIKAHSKKIQIKYEEQIYTVNELLYNAINMVNTTCMLRHIFFCDVPRLLQYSFYWNRTPRYEKIKSKDSYIATLERKHTDLPPDNLSVEEWQAHLAYLKQTIESYPIDQFRIVRPRSPEVVIQTWSEDERRAPIKSNLPILNVGKASIRTGLQSFKPFTAKARTNKFEYQCLSAYLHLYRVKNNEQ